MSTSPAKTHTPPATLTVIRHLLLAIFLLGALSTGTELLLVGHTESLWQWVPLLLISISLVALVGHAVSRGAASVQVFQVTMILFMISGLLGIVLHYQGRVEFKLETNPALSGLELFWQAIKGAVVPPSLAPGMMIQLGLLGLAYTYRHPALMTTIEKNGSKENDMNQLKSLLFATIISLALAAGFGVSVESQVGRQQGLVDPNLASEKDLLALPHLNPTVVKGIIERRPFMSMTDLSSFLSQSLSKEQLAELYAKTFVHLNLNTATREEILMIPGVGNRMAREFLEYRPYKTLAQFRREIGKYVDANEVARLEKYVFVPINLNTASDEDILSIPGVGQRMLREFKEYRPYQNIEQFRREIGKYVNQKEVARLERYVTVN